MDVEVDFEKMIEYTEDLNIVLLMATSCAIVIESGDLAPAHKAYDQVGKARIRRAMENLTDLAQGSERMIGKTLDKLENRLSKNNGGNFTEPLQAA